MGSFSGWKNVQFQVESINIAPNFFRFTFRFIDRQLRIVAEVGAWFSKSSAAKLQKSLDIPLLYRFTFRININ